MQKESLVDIGVNFTASCFKEDRAEVLVRAYQANVQQIVITGTSEPDSHRAVDLCHQYDETEQHLFATVGVHPHCAKDWHSETTLALATLLQQPCVKAVGECGLDFNRDFSSRAIQESVFEAQLALAMTHVKPVFMHERDAYERFVGVLKDYRDLLSAAVVHCFTGDKKSLYHYLDMDLYIGVTGWICDERRGKHLHELVKDIPSDRLLLETDAPYLLPRTLNSPPKNRRNEPAFLPEVLKVVAQCRGELPAKVAEYTTCNARTFFNLPVCGS